MTRDEQLKEAWGKITYPEFMEVCEKYQLLDYELREYNDRLKRDHSPVDQGRPTGP